MCTKCYLEFGRVGLRKKVTENEFGEMCEKWVELPTQRKYVAGEIVNNEYIMNK